MPRFANITVAFVFLLTWVRGGVTELATHPFDLFLQQLTFVP